MMEESTELNVVDSKSNHESATDAKVVTAVDTQKQQEIAQQIAADPLKYLPTKSTTWTIWQETIGLAQVTKMRGNFWRKYGFSVNNVNFLYPEEMLCLVEKKSIVVTPTVSTPQALTDLLDKATLFEKALNFIPLPIYLCYAKLKSLDYIVLRHKKSVRMFASDAELYDYFVKNPTHTLLDAMVSYDVFVDNDNFSKKLWQTNEIFPAAYAVLTDGPVVFSPRVILKLLEEANKIPILFVAITNTGAIILEEMTNALQSINLTNKMT